MVNSVQFLELGVERMELLLLWKKYRLGINTSSFFNVSSESVSPLVCLLVFLVRYQYLLIHWMSPIFWDILCQCLIECGVWFSGRVCCQSIDIGRDQWSMSKIFKPLVFGCLQEVRLRPMHSSLKLRLRHLNEELLLRLRRLGGIEGWNLGQLCQEQFLVSN